MPKITARLSPLGSIKQIRSQGHRKSSTKLNLNLGFRKKNSGDKIETGNLMHQIALGQYDGQPVQIKPIHV